MSFFPGMETIGSVDDLLDFSSDIGEEDDYDDKPRKACPSLNSKCAGPSLFNPLVQVDPNHSFSVSLIFPFSPFRSVWVHEKYIGFWLGYELLLLIASVIGKRETIRKIFMNCALVGISWNWNLKWAGLDEWIAEDIWCSFCCRTSLSWWILIVYCGDHILVQKIYGVSFIAVITY